MGKNYSGNLLIHLKDLVSHLNGLIQMAHGFGQYYRIRNIVFVDNAVHAELLDTTEEEIYDIIIKPREGLSAKEKLDRLPESF